jgi:hypothetical protein
VVLSFFLTSFVVGLSPAASRDADAVLAAGK